MGWFFLGLALSQIVRVALHRLTGVTETDQILSASLATLFLHSWTLAGIVQLIKQNQMSWAQAFGPFRPKWRLWLGIGIALGTTEAVTLIAFMIFWRRLLEGLNLSYQPQLAVEALSKELNPIALATLTAMTLIIAPVIEELLFRGILYQALRDQGYPLFALLGSSAIFAAFHSSVTVFIPLFLFACAQAIVYEKTHNIWPVIFSHAVFNLVNYVLIIVQRG